MTSRREFLQAGLAASVFPLSVTAGFRPAVSAAGDARPAAPIYTTIFDRRFPAGVAFAGEMKRLGAPRRGFSGDITDLWFQDLDVRWRQGPVAVAGLTAHGPLFCLERLAWDHGMRVVFRADHTRLANGAVEHVLSGPAALLEQADFGDGESDWACRAARLVFRCPPGGAAISTTTTMPSPSASTEAAGLEMEPLHSWLIAPVVRA